MYLIINPEYSVLVPKHSVEDYDRLESGIIAHGGAFESIKINRKNEILDGHTRYEICTKHELPFKTEFIDLPSVLNEKIYVIETNLKRRHLNKFQRSELGMKLLPIEEELAKQRMIEAGKIGADLTNIGVSSNELTSQKGQARDITAKKVGVSPTTFHRVKKIIEQAPEKIIDDTRNGKRSINSAYAIVREQERQENRNKVLEEVTAEIPEGITILQTELKNVDSLQPETAQLILTDPPYPKEYLQLYDELAEFAKKMLVPGGYLITYCGHFHLPTIIEKLGKHLEYFWTLALTQNKHRLVHSRHVFCDWKPILIFYKPPLVLPPYFGDVISGTGREKSHHEWQQGVAELEPIITKFCPENGLIIDPFAGSGTTLLAARTLGRKCIGIESNPETYKIMVKRLADNESVLSKS